MSGRFWTIAAALSAAVVAVSVPNASPAGFGPGWSREAAVQRAVAAAAALGIETAAWEVRVSTSYELADRLRWRRLPAHPLRALFSPLVYQVLFRDRVSGRRFEIDLYESGRVAYLKIGRGAPLEPQNAFTLLAGPDPQRFEPQAPEKDSKELRWVLAEPGQPQVGARLRVDAQDGGALEAWLEPHFSKEYESAEVPEKIAKAVAKGLIGMFVIFAIGAAIFRTLRMIRRRRDHLRFALVPVVIYLAVLTLYGLTGQGGTRFGFGLQNDPWRAGDFFGSYFGRPWVLFLPLAAGFTWARGRDAWRWTGAVMAATGRLSSRRAARELHAGFAAGCALAALYSLALALGVPGSATSLPLLDRWPLLGSAARFIATHSVLLLVIAWAFPWLERREKKRWWWGSLSWLAGTLACSAGTGPMEIAGWYEWPLALLTWTIYRYVYRDQGLLALLGAAAFSGAATNTALALAGGNTAPGAFSLAILLLAFGAAGYFARHGRAINEEEIAAELDRRNQPSARDLLSEREMLLGEFAEARAAQRALLPAQPPQIEGYSLAAACLPAREVGGDLYDFLPFPGERWGLCVADVSGKGVPASLYMTLLKGMLLAESTHSTSLDGLARAVNGRLLAAGRRRTFVTLALGLLDPPTGRVELLRAGHNPPLLLRASGESEFLLPGGLGLGLTSNRLFERTLRQQTLEMGPGDLLVLYSDGLTEAMNHRRELFGEERLLGAVERMRAGDASQVLAAILEDLDAFRNGADPHDDLTLLVIRKLPEGGAQPI